MTKFRAAGVVAVWLAGSLLLAMASPATADVVPIVTANQCPFPKGECHEIRGTISRADVTAIQVIANRALSSSIQTGFFRLNSRGGDVDAAVEIGRILRSISAIAAMPDRYECLSACVLVLAGATQRAISSRAVVGIHRPYSLQTDIRDYKVAQAQHTRMAIVVKTYLSEMNLPTSLYDAMMRIPSEEIRVLERAELASYGLTQTDPVQQELFDASEARQYGISRLELVSRKAKVASDCALNWAKGQQSGSFGDYFSCKERVMRQAR